MRTDYRKLVETACLDCVIDVIAWAPQGDAAGTPGWINVGLLSNHVTADHRTWRGRLGRAINALRARDVPFLEFCATEDLEGFTKALAAAGEVAFGQEALLA